MRDILEHSHALDAVGGFLAARKAPRMWVLLRCPNYTIYLNLYSDVRPPARQPGPYGLENSDGPCRQSKSKVNLRQSQRRVSAPVFIPCRMPGNIDIDDQTIVIQNTAVAGIRHHALEEIRIVGIVLRWLAVAHCLYDHEASFSRKD